MKVAKIAIFWAIVSVGCRSASPSDEGAQVTTSASALPQPSAQRSEADKRKFDDLIAPNRSDHRCTFSNGGWFIEFADEAARVTGAEVVEHDGALWARVATKELKGRFLSTRDGTLGPDGERVTSVEVKLRPRGAKFMSVLVNDKPFGTQALVSGEIATVTVTGLQRTVVSGVNTISLLFRGSAKGGRADVMADVQWARLNGASGSSAPPTYRDLVTQSTAGGESKRAITLQGPAIARCLVWAPPGSVFDGSVALLGKVEGGASVHLLRDGKPPRVLFEKRLSADGAWNPIHIPIGNVGARGEYAVVEFGSVTPGARLAFAEPRISVKPGEIPPEPVARGVVLVILGSLAPSTMALFGGSIDLPELQRFATEGVVFANQRSVSTWARESVAAMLTGVMHDDAPDPARERSAARRRVRTPPRELKAIVSGDITASSALQQAGVATAMFTANPTTTAPFGFDRGWATFQPMISRAAGHARDLFDEAARWIDEHPSQRFFVVIHARGGHPPWDVTSHELKLMPPAGYMGLIEPLHANQLLAVAGRPQRLSAADRERATALYSAALKAHDVALGHLLASLRAHHASDTLVAVTSDIAMRDGAAVPFEDGAELDYAHLNVPLVVRFPGKRLAGRRVVAATSNVDIANTVIAAFGLPPPVSFRGANLWALANDRQAEERGELATTRGRFSAQRGNWVMFGPIRNSLDSSTLCDLLGRGCPADEKSTAPFWFEGMRAESARLLRELGPPRVEEAAIDYALRAALTAWGD